MGPAHELHAEKVTPNFNFQCLHSQQSKSLLFDFKKAAMTIQHWFLKARDNNFGMSSGS